MSSEKDRIRQNILRRRSSLSHMQRLEKSKSICNILEEKISEVWPRHARILFFAPHNDEVDIMPLFDELTGKLHAMYDAFFPKITNFAAGEFETFPVRMRADLRKSPDHFGIAEPVTRSSLSPQELDLILVPAVAIDAEGRRIGYGRGFYDRFLPQAHSSCQKWAVIFSSQKVEKIPEESHDVRVDAMVDENGLFVFPKV